ncbi:MAG: hypothetical protein HIU84_02375 [Acidobacteria bacterium]|nr:hypothetical protein [Acidobacteriota bacterium]
MKGIVERMVGRVRRGPFGLAEDDDTWARGAVAFGSLVILCAGVVGKATSTPAVSAFGFFLYGLVGFGAATLMTLGRRGWDLLVLAAPLGLGFLLVAGALLSTTGIWALGPALFWCAVAASATIHVSALTGSIHSARKHRVVDRGSPTLPTNWRGLPTALFKRIVSRPVESSHVFVVSATGLGLVLCLESALSIKNLDPGWGGLLSVISPNWYLGLGVLVIAIFAGRRVGGVFTGLPVVVLQLCLTGTPALVYAGPRYAWTIKQVGETSYILLHGFANPRIDIYQAWPGLFSATAWLCRVSSLHNPVMVARWWPPIIDLATLLVVYYLASRVLGDSRRAWLAATIFVVGYAIGDADYFSSQSAAYLLAITIFAVVYRRRDEPVKLSTSEWLLLLTLAIAEAVTHQLTPYMVTSALGVLWIFGRTRTRWAPVITLAPAVLWALAHFAYVSQNVSFSALFNIFANVTTPGVSTAGPSPGTLANVFRIFQGASVLIIGLLAVAAIVRHRTILQVFLAACAASAGSLLLANSYGNEADFRVILFALPWLAILGSTLQPTSRYGANVFWPVAISVLLPIYLVADMGLDFVYLVRNSDLAAVRYFETNAPKGSVMITMGQPENNPINYTGRFDILNETNYPNVLGYDKAAARNPAISYQQFMTRLQSVIFSIPSKVIGPAPQYFVLFIRSEAAYLATYNYATLQQYQGLSDQFARSRSWQSVLRTSTAQLYRLRL